MRRSSRRGLRAAKRYTESSLELLVLEGVLELVGDDLVAVVIGVDAVRLDVIRRQSAESVGHIRVVSGGY